MLECFDYHYECFEIHGIPLIVEYPRPEGITQLLVFEGLTQHSSHQIMLIEEVSRPGFWDMFKP